MSRTITTNDLTIIGIRGTVLALDSATGQEVWRTPLKGWQFTNLAREGDRIFAAAQGQVFCLDALNGQILWSNGLRGFGYGIVTFAAVNQTPAAAQQQHNDASNSVAANASITVPSR